MTPQQKEEVFSQHRFLIYALIKRAHSRYPHIPFEDYEEKGLFALCECCHKYFATHKSSAKLSTYLTKTLRGIFKNMVAQHILILNTPADDPLPEIGINGKCSPERLLRLKQALSSMSEEAVEVVNLIFNTPKELSQIMIEDAKALPTKETLRKYLWSKRWSGIEVQNRISQAFSEIKQTLNNI